MKIWTSGFYIIRKPCKICGSKPKFIARSKNRLLMCGKKDCEAKVISGKDRWDTLQNWNSEQEKI